MSSPRYVTRGALAGLVVGALCVPFSPALATPQGGPESTPKSNPVRVIGSPDVDRPESAVTGVLPRRTASVGTDQTWSVPPRARITLPGRGYGHGKGMSQYGAQGAATQGRSFAQILGFYYPGTTAGKAGQAIRIWLSTETLPGLTVNARAGLQVRDRATGTVHKLSDPAATRWRLIRTGTGQLALGKRTDRWQRIRTFRGEAEFSAPGPLGLLTSSGVKPYRGALRWSAGRTINVLPLDAYVRGVVALEVPALWHPQAVRAQSVAARTYAAFERADRPQAAYHLCDTSACQVYGGVSAEHPAATEAVQATAGVIRTAGGKPAFTQFSASSGGWTTAGSRPYLRAQKDPYDGWSGNPYHTWRTSVTDADLERQWPAVGDLRRIRVTRRDGNGEWRGRVERLELTGSKGTVTLSGDDLRSRLGLRSTWFSFEVAAR